MPEEKLTCTKVIKRFSHRTSAGELIYYHKKCGLPATELEINGHSFTARAVLCHSHRIAAEREAFEGYQPKPFSKSKMEARERAGQQRLIP